MFLDWDLIKKYSSENKLDHVLVGAIITQESGGNPKAYRYEPNYHYHVTPEKFATKYGHSVDTEKMLQACSYGLMQTMGCKVREIGYAGNLVDHELFKPELSLFYGCKFLVTLTRKHKNLNDIIASYNAGSPLFTSNGLYVNQLYVNEVKQKMKNLLESKK